METPNKTPQTKPPLKPEEGKKGLLNKLQDLSPDREEQLQIVGVAVRLGIVIWSGFCLTLAYIDLPGFPKQTFDPTFIASVFTGALSSFGLTTAKNKGNGDSISKKDMEKILSNSYQTIRVETPIKIEGAELVKSKRVDPITGREIDDSGKLV